MDDELKDNVKSPSTWRRGLFMVLFFVFYGFGEALLFLIVVFQFLHSLIAGDRNEALLEFSENLCAYLYEIMLYVSYNSEERPFPFAPWPSEEEYAQAPLFEDRQDDELDIESDTAESVRADSAPELEVVRDVPVAATPPTPPEGPGNPAAAAEPAAAGAPSVEPSAGRKPSADREPQAPSGPDGRQIT